MVRILVPSGLRNVLLLNGAFSDRRCVRQCDESDCAVALPVRRARPPDSVVRAALGNGRAVGVHITFNRRPDVTILEAEAHEPFIPHIPRTGYELMLSNDRAVQ